MPIFEYICGDCGHPFEAVVIGSAAPQCPSCGGGNLSKQISAFAVGGNSRELAAREPGGPCASCGDPRGPGSCALD